MRILASLIAAFLFSLPAYACRPLNLPRDGLLESYTNIFSGEVVGVRLVEYEKIRLRGKRSNDPDYVLVVDATPTFEVRVLVDRTHRGHHRHIQKMRLGGCGVSPPAPHERGIFFSGSGHSHAAFASQEEDYEYWRKKLGER